MSSISNESRAWPKSPRWWPGVASLLALTLIPAVSHSQAPSRQVPVESLIYDLKNPDPVRRKEAAMQIGNNKIQRAVPDLVAAAGDKDPAVRREIVIALDKLADIRALPAFLQLSSDSERDIRDKCIQSMVSLYIPKEGGLSGTMSKVANFFNPWSDEWGEVVVEPGTSVDPSAVAALGSRLQDSDEGIRARAARALGILKGKDALPALVEALRQDGSNAVRFEVIRSLRKISDSSVGKELIPFISFNEPKVRHEAIYTLGRLRCRDAITELTQAYESEAAKPAKKADRNYQQLLLDAIAFVANPTSEDLFLREIKSEDETLRLHAYEGLARIGNSAHTSDTARAHINENNRKVRIAQAYALFRMGRREHLDEIVRALDSRKTSGEARQYLLELKTEDLPELYAETKFQEQAVREGLAEVMGLIGDSQAIPVLQELSKDTRGQISALCNQAIRRIGARTGG